MKEKDYKINEAILVTYHTLDAIYQHFSSGYPEEIEKKIIELITDLMQYIEPNTDFGNNDKDTYEIIRREFLEK